METTTYRHRTFFKLFMLMISLSSIVFMEPAPYDLLMLSIVFVAVFSGYMLYADIHFCPMFSLLLFLTTNILSLYFIKEIPSAISYLLVTVYCMAAWAGLTGIAFFFGKKLLPVLFNAYTAAALLVAVPGIIAYHFPASVLDIFLWDGDRVQGLFKDPNVFGPFLIPPALYALWRMGKTSQSRKALLAWLGIFLIIAVGILLSFSRAAWGQFILTLGICFLMINDRSTQRMKTLFILTIVVIPVLIFLVMMTDAGELFFNRTSLQQYDTVRFQQQEKSIDYILDYPFGFGPGQSEFFLSQSTHNLFIRTFSENGLLGLLFFLVFWMITLVRSVQVNHKVDWKYKGYFVIITASLIGILFNSMFIDTMHWRHFWMLLALPWMNVNGKGHWEQ